MNEIRLQIALKMLEVAPRADIRNIDEVVARCKAIEEYVSPPEPKVAAKKARPNANKSN